MIFYERKDCEEKTHLVKHLPRMYWCYLSYLIIVFFGYFDAYGQERRREIELQVGGSYLARQDLVFSPFIHQNFSLHNIGIGYRRESKLYHDINLKYGSYRPMLINSYEFINDNDIEVTEPHHFTFIDIDYRLGKEVRSQRTSKSVLGISLAADIQALTYSYGNITNFGYYAAFGLGGFFRHTASISKRSKLTGHLVIPMISWLARSPYLVNDDEFIENISSHSASKIFVAFIGDGKIVTLDRLQSLDLGFNYVYSINSKWSLGGGYLFEFSHAKYPRNLLSYRNSVYVTTSFKF